MEQERIWNIRIRIGWGSAWIISFIFDVYDIFGFLTMPDFTMECSDYYFCGQLDHFKGNTLFVLNWVHMKSVMLYHILYTRIIWLLESHIIYHIPYHIWYMIRYMIHVYGIWFIAPLIERTCINDFRVRKFCTNCTRFTKKSIYHQAQFFTHLIMQYDACSKIPFTNCCRLYNLCYKLMMLVEVECNVLLVAFENRNRCEAR